MIQRQLFEPTLIKSASLIAPDSPRQAFYNIRLFAYKNIYTVRKESGAKGKTWDVRLWKFDSFEKAEKDFERRIKQKTNPNRKSERIYKVRATDNEIKKPQPSKKRTTYNSRSYPSHQGYQGHQAASV